MTRHLRARLLTWVGIALCLAAARGLLAQGGQAQEAPPLPPPINQSDDPVLKRFVWRSIGPATMGGRIDDIAVERMRYNERVTEYNTLRRRFPANVTAKMFGFKEYPYWEAPPEAQKAPKVDFK